MSGLIFAVSCQLDDAGYCAGMTLGWPEISLDGLNEFATVLASLGTNRKQGAQSSCVYRKPYPGLSNDRIG
jgi:hypothetical protein